MIYIDTDNTLDQRATTALYDRKHIQSRLFASHNKKGKDIAFLFFSFL